MKVIIHQYLQQHQVHSEIVKILLERPDIEIDKGAKNDETLFYVSCERGMD